MIRFAITNHADATIEMDTACDVLFRRGELGWIGVQVEGEGVEVRQVRDRVTIIHRLPQPQRGPRIGMAIMGDVHGDLNVGAITFDQRRGPVVQQITITGGNVDSIIGSVSGNYQAPRPQARPPQPLPRVIVTVPPQCTLDAKFAGGSVIYETPATFESAYVDISNRAIVSLQVEGMVNATATTHSSLHVNVTHARVKAWASTQATIAVYGGMSSADVAVESNGIIETRGTIEGDFDARATTGGMIDHTGHIAGKVRKTQDAPNYINIFTVS